MKTFNTITEIIQYLIISWAGLTTLYMLFYSIMGNIYKTKTMNNKITSQNNFPRIAVMIPAYKEDNVIVRTVENALKQNYPIGKFQVIVIGDHLLNSTICKLKKLPIHLHEVNFTKSTKAKALNYALDNTKNNFDLMVLLDADNIIEPDFLTKMSIAFINGHKAIQGHRTAKNHNTNHSLLDAISEEINNHIFCKGQQYVGLSSRLTGSGMAFEYQLFKDLMSNINAVGGFDKELEIKLLSSEIKIHYVDNAIVYDEKVSNSEVLVNQRKRWISSQLHYMRKYALTGIQELILNKNFDYFNKSLQLLLLPRAFMFMILIMGIIFSTLLQQHNLSLIWLSLFAAYVLVFLIAFPSKFLSKRLFKTALQIPKTILKMTFTFPQLFNANKEFIHTPHTS